jgi:hypothetical protein
MNSLKAAATCCAISLSACASAPNTEPVMVGLPHSENFHIQRSQSPEYDYLVSVKNGKDLGINADNQGARDRMALLALKDQCEAPQIVREVVVNSGSELFGSGDRTYQLQVKC